MLTSLILLKTVKILCAVIKWIVQRAAIANILCVLESAINFEVKCAVDINTVTNTVYKHNFPGHKLAQRQIQVELLLDHLRWIQYDMVYIWYSILVIWPCITHHLLL